MRNSSTPKLHFSLLITLAFLLSAGSVKSSEGEAPAHDEILTPETGYCLSLQESEELALQYSHALQAARLGREVAVGKIMTAWGEALPVVGASFSKTMSDTYAQKRLRERRDRWDNLYTGAISIEQPIFSGGKVAAALRGAKLYREDVEEGIRFERQGLIYSVRTTYYEILLNQALEQVAQEQAQLTQQHLDDIKNRLEMGVATDYDVLRAEVEKTNVQTTLTNTTNALLNSKNDFLRLLGLPLSSKFVLTDALEYAPFPTDTEEALYRRALALRPELRSSRLAIQMQQELYRATRADLFPQLSLAGQYSGSSDDFGRSLNDYDKAWQVGLTLNWTLFDAFLVRGQLKEQAAVKEQLIYLEKDLADQVRLEVRRALLDIESALQSLQSQKRNVDQARESLRLTNVREREGVSIHLDVLNARQALAVAERNYYRAVYDYKIAWADLDLAMGQIDEDESLAKPASEPEVEPAQEAIEADDENPQTKLLGDGE
ncbi:MAG: TolC family protein [Planctomycetes bacterium]|nr:TolC family protein [Planctomycetota bacterium]